MYNPYAAPPAYAPAPAQSNDKTVIRVCGVVIAAGLLTIGGFVAYAASDGNDAFDALRPTPPSADYLAGYQMGKEGRIADGQYAYLMDAPTADQVCGQELLAGNYEHSTGKQGRDWLDGCIDGELGHPSR
ncbi:hypothetical protein ACFXDJ_06710 [Streptomyces sp. NPDC059443]|uniref:hypothetical protein n=1 Tax=unclassified Streptomyces TaxID=2593676 RepID=UPI0036A9FCA3